MTLLQSFTGARAWRTAELVITDVTRMQGDSVCIAGQEGRTSLRLHEPAPSERWLRSIGGLTPGDLVSVSVKRPRQTRRPHLEDGDWNPSSLEKRRRLADDELASLLLDSAHRSVSDVFGKPSLVSDAGNAAFQPGKGSRSLASLSVSWVRVYPFGSGVRADFAESSRKWQRVPVEDLAIRTHEGRCGVCASHLADLLSAEFDGGPAVLRIGLGRPFQADSSRLSCWMQLNHIILVPSRREHFV
jgi:hypothetical protein